MPGVGSLCVIMKIPDQFCRDFDSRKKSIGKVNAFIVLVNRFGG
jgi:hypothetical protein